MKYKATKSLISSRMLRIKTFRRSFTFLLLIFTVSIQIFGKSLKITKFVYEANDKIQSINVTYKAGEGGNNYIINIDVNRFIEFNNLWVIN